MSNEDPIIAVYQCHKCHRHFASLGELQLHEHVCMSRHAEAPETMLSPPGAPEIKP